MNSLEFIQRYLEEAKEILDRLDQRAVAEMVQCLSDLRDRKGRLFVIGSGGGAGHASHAVCDFRKICGIETYCPLDNISELTARINDEGWDQAVSDSLLASNLSKDDAILIFSVGGGNAEKNISVNLVNAVKTAQAIGCTVLGVVGRDGGYTASNSKVTVVVPSVAAERITPHTESIQALVWHLLVSHPELQINKTKWESSV